MHSTKEFIAQARRFLFGKVIACPVAESHETLGRYLTEHVAFNSIQGFFPQLAGRAASNDDGPGEASLYIPRYNFGHKDRKKFLRGYRFSFDTGCSMGPGPGARAWKG